MSDFKQETSSFNAFIPKKWQDTGWSQGDLSNTLLRSARPGLKEPGLKDGVAALGLRGDELKTKPATLADAQSIPAAQDDRSPRAKEDAPAVTQARPPEPPQAAQPIIVNPAMKSSTPAFAPVLAAGALSALMKDRAAAPDSTAKKMDNNPSKAFQYGMVEDGSEAARARRYHNTTDEMIHQYDAADSNNDFYYQYMMQQQFMQSQEYAIALETAGEYLSDCKNKMEAARLRLQEAEERVRQDREALENHDATTAQIQTEMQDRKDSVDAAIDAHGEHEEKKEATAEAQVVRDELCSPLDQAKNNAIMISGKDTYITVNEGGKEVVYKVGENGPERIEGKRPPASEEDLVFKKTGADGKTEYVDSKGQPVSQEKVDQINQATGKMDPDKPVLTTSYEHYQKVVAADGASCTRAEFDLDNKKQEEAASLEKYKELSGRVGYSVNDIAAMKAESLSLGAEIQDFMKKQAEKRVELEGNLAASEAEKKAAADAYKQSEAEYKKAEDFYNRLEKGDFKDRQEMLDAMPDEMRMQYEQKMQAQAPAQAQAPTTTEPVNTSRTNGSAAPPAIAASKDVSSDFASASQGTAPANANSPVPEQAPEKKVAATAPVAAPAP